MSLTRVSFHLTYVCEQLCQEKVVFTGSTSSAHSPDCLGQEELEVEGHVTQSLAKPCKGDWDMSLFAPRASFCQTKQYKKITGDVRNSELELVDHSFYVI